MVKTTIKQKIGLIIFGILISFIILEFGLRTAGFIVSYQQRVGNKITDHAIAVNKESGYRILVLGESTTAGGEIFWPHQLEILLNNRSKEIKFKVFNEAIIGTNTAFILSRLKDNLDKYKPDMVITMMGINDRDLQFKYEDIPKVKIALLIKNLRIFKLIDWLMAGYKNEPNDFHTSQDVNNTVRKESEAIKKDMLSAYLYLEQGRIKEAEKIYMNVLKINPNNSEAYVRLGGIYYAEGRKEEAIEMYEKAIEINPNKDEGYTKLGQIFEENHISKQEIESFYKKMGFSFKIQDNPSSEITKYHYQLLYDALEKKGIKYIVMQYPTLNIDELKKNFQGDENIIFVSNEENFKNVLENGKYEDYFVDHFGGNWGHCTPKGHRLIAQNVANVILRELKIES